MTDESIPQILEDFQVPVCEDVCPDKCYGCRELIEVLREDAVKWIKYLRKHNGYYTRQNDLIEFKPWERLQVEVWIMNFFGIKSIKEPVIKAVREGEDIGFMGK